MTQENQSKAKKTKWVELSPTQILAIEESLNNNIPYFKGLETLQQLIVNCKRIKLGYE